MTRKMEKREKILLAGAVSMLLVFMLFFLFRGGGEASSDQDPAELMMKKEMLRSRIKKYEKTKAKIDRFDKKIRRTPENYDLIGQMSKTCKELGLTLENIAPHESGSESDPYNEKSVTMNLDDLTLLDLVNLLKEIESSPAFLKVTRMNVKRKTFSEDSLLNVRIRVAVYWPKPEGQTGDKAL
ncbi:MAG: hypothetical protein R6V10_09690 [bacterium]